MGEPKSQVEMVGRRLAGLGRIYNPDVVEAGTLNTYRQQLELLPAFVLGWETEEVPPLGDMPPWVHTIEHPCGGAALRQPWLTGCLMRLTTNIAMAELLVDAGLGKYFELVSALVQMGDRIREPDDSSLRRMLDELTRLGDNNAEISDVQRASLSELLETHLSWPRGPFPKVSSGMPALLRFEPSNLVYFDGWRMLEPALTAPCTWGEDGSVSGSIATCFGERLRFSRATFRQLCLMSPTGEAPRAFLLWGNASDAKRGHRKSPFGKSKRKLVRSEYRA